MISISEQQKQKIVKFIHSVWEHNEEEAIKKLIELFEELFEQRNQFVNKTELKEFFLEIDKSFKQIDQRFQDLLYYLEQRFKEQKEFIEKRFEEINRRFEEQKEFTEKRFEEINRRFEEQKEFTEKRFEEQKEFTEKRFEEMNRRFRLLQWFFFIGFTFLTTLVGFLGFLNVNHTKDYISREIQEVRQLIRDYHSPKK